VVLTSPQVAVLQTGFESYPSCLASLTGVVGRGSICSAGAQSSGQVYTVERLPRMFKAGLEGEARLTEPSAVELHVYSFPEGVEL
jgi:hypothetical protein